MITMKTQVKNTECFPYLLQDEIFYISNLKVKLSFEPTYIHIQATCEKINTVSTSMYFAITNKGLTALFHIFKCNLMKNQKESQT